MSDKTDDEPMKSAYEVALERLREQGLVPPSADSLSPATKEAVSAARAKAEAALAELEILHRDRLRKVSEPAKVEEEKKNYIVERQRIETRRDREIDRLRASD